MSSDVPVEVAPADKVAFLGAAKNHAVERPERVHLRETHMSWVFLTDRFAYKLKKPVCHPLNDLRSTEARYRNCLVEVRLNRRLAPDVYLGIEPLSFVSGGAGLRLGGDGSIVDWLIVMRRLPDRMMLDHALREGGPGPEDLDRVAQRLARFYQALSAEPVTPEMRRAWVEREIELSWRALGRADFALGHARAERLVGRVRDFLRVRTDLFAERHWAGRIVEGHGDLRPEHVWLEPEPVVIDCLEFSRMLRLVDPADEMAFLALECGMLGQPGAGERLQRCYEEFAHDRPPEALVAWYAAFRALIRARLSALHSLEPGPQPPAAWLARAIRYLDAGLAYTELMG